MHNKPARSDEPIFWLLFGTGGMTVAIVLPAILIVLLAAGLSSPDMTSGLLNFEQVKGMLGNWFVSLIIFGVIATVFFHAFHRIFHTLHDLKLHYTKLFWFALYGGAAALTFITFGVQFAVYCKLW